MPQEQERNPQANQPPRKDAPSEYNRDKKENQSKESDDQKSDQKRDKLGDRS